MNRFNWKRIVIKVGSALIAPHGKGCSSEYLISIAEFIVSCRSQGIEVVLVSSGSVAAGSHLFPDELQQTIPIKKAMAAAGQAEMMGTWEKLFDFPTAQMLLTRCDLRDRERYVSVRETIFTLLEHDVLPIINENDTIVTDKLKVGDNDNLSAIIAAAADADALIICSDINGLYNKNPNKHDDAVLIPNVPEITADIFAMADGATSAVGTGGMITKVEAAQKATLHGIDTYIVNGFTEQTFEMLLNGENPGTHFSSDPSPMKEHLHWMTHTSTAQGEVIVEDDFTVKLDAHSEELTSDDLLEIKGEFAVGDTILIRKHDGTKLAKAKSNYGSCLLSFITNQEDKNFASDFQEQTGPIISDKHVALLETL
ncbi:glutamate 5-kinase [Paraglaciecola sp. MB-3u-78]|jgi:glutamate 5-kinase|uniref:glutamate 5-kinase n=1 Tax=Paraglaciecola sp. MB-3u-78 TaxID=2058332 RepID=UPI000C31CDF2|nr:glutamate 5-kinase [Paraglaciecola sp. MB-3u-78]PKG97317.1 glutamate 5-kinase [Paraglaciecola sp. MB-3u-78]